MHINNSFYWYLFVSICEDVRQCSCLLLVSYVTWLLKRRQIPINRPTNMAVCLCVCACDVPLCHCIENVNLSTSESNWYSRLSECVLPHVNQAVSLVVLNLSVCLSVCLFVCRSVYVSPVTLHVVVVLFISIESLLPFSLCPVIAEFLWKCMLLLT